jgi:3-hydroxy-9,10-secoandrosta-1,3,5(10)-triene-9,17-dione monooxygenase
LTIKALTISVPRTIAPPEPELTPADLLVRAESLRPVLRERQAATERAGRLLDETHAAFVDAGFYRILQPRRFGGYEVGLRDFVRVMSEISRGCPSSGWVLALTAGHPHLLAHFGEQAQAEVYGADGDARVPGRPVQAGDAVASDGGYVVSGAWDYASGCDHATHFMGSALVRGSEPPRLLWLLIDRADFSIVDNWEVIGLRGTGSKRVACENVFVPEHRTITAVGTTDEPWPGWRTHENPLYAGGLFSLLFFELGAIAVGVARGAIDEYEDVLRSKALDIPPFVLRGHVDEYQHHLGHAVALVDVAEAALLEGTDRYLVYAKRALESGRPADETAEETRRLILLQQQCIRLAGEAADLLFRTGGTSGARTGSRMANAMLALTVLRTHMGLQWDRTMTNLGRLRLGQTAGFV